MKRSTDRILTTHAGSLPRPEDLKLMMWDKLDGKPVDVSQLKARVREAVMEIVAKQDHLGIDFVSDGEVSKPGFSNYMIERYSGFTHNRTYFERLDMADAPNVARQIMDTDAGRHVVFTEVVGSVALQDRAAIQTDLDNFKAALGGRDLDQTFVTAVTPGQTRHL
jgi:5-methyltetrahydropteroyltriglutamate--homocysteine methyltransferase